MVNEKKRIIASYISADVVLSEEEKKKFENKYNLHSDIQKTCGQIILGIMEKENIDVIKAMRITGLNKSVFNKLKDPKCYIPREMVISFGVGLGLNVKATEYLLEANGMVFNVNDRLDCAYIHILENYSKEDIETCNGVLRDLGFEDKYFLGAHERGIYRPRKTKE